MNITRPRDHEIYIRLAPSLGKSIVDFDPTAQSAWASKTDVVRSYDASIYTNLIIPGLNQDQGSGRFPGTDMLTQMPLRAVEQVMVKWGRYQEYLATFVEGTKEPRKMKERLLETLSPGLQVLFSAQSLADKPVRIWWSSETPELEDLPWELIAYEERTDASQVSFVRGSPLAAPEPPVPVDGPLRLALISSPGYAPTWIDLFDLLPPTIQVHKMTLPPREGLGQAIADGFELIHIVCDGIVSLAYEGILYLLDSALPELSAVELSELLRGSRVRVLGLTESSNASPDSVVMGSREVRSVYRAFAYLGRGASSLPNIVAPLGPQFDFMLRSFWTDFYAGLGETLEIEQAMARARQSVGPQAAALALNLRQNGKRTFQSRAMVKSDLSVEPTQMNADLQQSRALVSQFNVLREQLGDLPESVKQFLDDEVARQNRLAASLEPWLDEGEA